MTDAGRCRVCGLVLSPGMRFCGHCGAPAEVGAEGVQDRADPLLGRVVADRYRIRRLVGRGGMGVVYEVEHVHIGKRLAMKLLRGELAHDPTTVRRLRREAEAASRLGHPGTVQVFDFGQSEGLTYLVMELVEGRDLGRVLAEEGPMPFERIGRILLSVVPALAEAHAAGIIHRDLKPENLMIVSDAVSERAKLLDFGLASLLREHFDGSTTGTIVGTPHTMAPEQIRGEDVDARSDVYSLGCVLVRALTGQPVFPEKTVMAVLSAHLATPPEPPSRRRPELGPDVDALVLRCLAKRPADRFEDVEAFGAAVAEVLGAHGVSLRGAEPTAAQRMAESTRRELHDFERRMRARTRVPLGLALTALAAIGVGGYFVWASSPSGAEREPNDGLGIADDVSGPEVVGQLGRRQRADLGDVDVHRFGARCRQIDVSLRALPNVDMVLAIHHEGARVPELSVDERGVGGDEALTGLPWDEQPVLAVVRERAVRGVPPVENVSDRYRLRVTCASSPDGEPDDSVASARRVRDREAVRGSFGWPGDVDVLCGPGPGRFTVSPDAALDVVLRPAAEHEAADTGGPGAPESAFVSTPSCVAIERKPASASEVGPTDVRSLGYGALFVAGGLESGGSAGTDPAGAPGRLVPRAPRR